MFIEASNGWLAWYVFSLEFMSVYFNTPKSNSGNFMVCKLLLAWLFYLSGNGFFPPES
jgi:hypothetical protein